MAGGDASFLGTLNATRTAFYFFFFFGCEAAEAEQLKFDMLHLCILVLFFFFIVLCATYEQVTFMRYNGTILHLLPHFYAFFSFQTLSPLLAACFHVSARSNEEEKGVPKRRRTEHKLFFFSELIFTLVPTSFILSSHCSFLIR